LVEELRVDALLPRAALIDQRHAQTNQRAQLEHVRRRDPRLRQLAGKEQPQLQIAVGVVGLRPPLAAASGRRLRRVGQMRAVAGALDLLDHEAPAGRPLSANATSQPANCPNDARSSARVAGAIRPRLSSPVSRSSAL
jgi:hypothetical protein